MNSLSNEEEIQVVIINNENEVAKEIEKSINTYLIKIKEPLATLTL